MELLFFDTFSHANTEELNMDLVQFKKSIHIQEVRVIPLGTKVFVDVPGGARMGATNPSDFKLELFVNNLNKQDAPTFQRLPVLEYRDNVNIVMEPEELIVTDGLVLKGWYTTITLAVYGARAEPESQKRRTPPPNPQPPPHMHQVNPQGPPAGPPMNEMAPAPPVPVPQPPIRTDMPPPGDWNPNQPPPQLPPTNVPPPSMSRPPPHMEGRPPPGFHPPDPVEFDPRVPPPQVIPQPQEPPRFPDDRYHQEGRPHDQDRRDLRPPESSPDYHRSDRDGRDFEQRQYQHEEGDHRGLRPRSPPPARSQSRSPGRRSRSPMSRGSSRSHDMVEEQETGEIGQEQTGELFDPLTPDGSQTEFGLSDGEIPENPDDHAYEMISSDEALFSDDEIPMMREAPEGQIELDMSEDAWSYAISSFNPYQCDLAPLETFDDPSLTEYQQEAARMQKQLPEYPDASRKLMDIFEIFADSSHHGRWVEALEGVPPLLPVGLNYLKVKNDHKEVLDALVEWAFEGLEMSRAMAQPETAYKVRHFKMGVKLAGAMCTTDPDIQLRMLEGGVQDKLIDLLITPHMAPSIQLHILRALDSTIRFQDGIDWLVGKHSKQASMEVPTQGWPYQRLVKLLLTKQPAQTVVGLSAMIRKVHAYEALGRLQQAVLRIAENVIPIERDAPPSMSGPEDGEQAMEAEEEMNLYDGVMTEDDLETIVASLEEVTKVMAAAEHLIAQPHRAIPVSLTFQTTTQPYDPYPGLYHLCHARHLLDSLYMLLSSPATASQPDVFVTIRDFLEVCLSSQRGLLFLSSKPVTVNGIVRALTQNAPMQEFNREEPPEENSANELGLQLIYHLQTLQNIDQLRSYHRKDGTSKGVDDAEVLGLLHSIYLMSFSPLGRQAIVNVFSMEDNLSVLFPFIQFTGPEERDARMKKSVCMSYTLLLLLLVVRYSTSAKLLQQYGPQLVAVSEQTVIQEMGGKMADRLAELQDWTTPLKKVTTLDCDSLEEIIKQLKQYGEDLAGPPKGLITTLKLLHHLAVPPVQKHKVKGKAEELKYRYAQLEIFSNDCLSILLAAIQKLCDGMLQSWQTGIPQSSLQLHLVMATVKPALSLVKAIMGQLIKARGAEFRDLSSLPALLSLHTIICSVPPGGVQASEAQSIQNEIVDTLLALTQPALQDHDSDEAISNSLWTLMLKEVLKYILTAPYTFLGGLGLLSELMPLPLPILAREALSEEEVNVAVNQRKLWSAHLHSLSSELQDVIKTLAGTTCQPLQHLLRRVCWQLADLAAPTSLSVVRCILDALLESMDANLDHPPPDRKEGDAEWVREEKRSSGQTSRILALLAFLMNQPPIKAAFISLAQGTGLKSDEKYTEVMSRLAALLNVVSDRTSHVQAQESIVNILQSLCDLEVTLVSGESNMSLQEQLANTLPGKQLLSVLCGSLLQHISNQDHSYSSVLPSLRTLALLMDHDYGFFQLKCALEKHEMAFFNLFTRINNTFSKDSSDCIATLSSAAECVQFMMTLVQPPEGGGELLPDRKLALSTTELRQVLRWTGGEDDMHPLDDLEKLLLAYAKEEEALKPVYEIITGLVTMVKEEDKGQQKQDMEEPVLPPAETLVNQFSLRATYLISDTEDDRLSPTYWFSTTPNEDSDHEQERVVVDLEEMAEKFCSGFDLRAELEKGSVPSDPNALRPRRKIRGVRRSYDTINTSRHRGGKRGFVAPMRGRGFGRGGMGNNRTDHFRSRPPNTSRPPSMHVDDFVKFETNPQHPIQAQTTRRNDKEMEHNIDRGGNFPSRGRFFSPPGSYGRREQGAPRGGGRGMLGSRGGMRGGPGLRGSMSGRGSPGNRGMSPWSQRAPRGGGFTGRGHMDNRTMSGDRRGGRDGPPMGRFPPRGGRGGFMGHKEGRFMGQGGGGFRGRRDLPPRHQRSFTK